jgi:hypothetical protein
MQGILRRGVHVYEVTDPELAKQTQHSALALDRLVRYPDGKDPVPDHAFHAD